jgi:hypothetical protein
MRPFGIPLWVLVLVACIVLPYAIAMWVDADRKRAHVRTIALLRRVDPTYSGERGPRRAARNRQEAPDEAELDVPKSRSTTSKEHDRE